MEDMGFFQDPYEQANAGAEEDDDAITAEDLAAYIETVHELNAKAQDLLDEKDFEGALPQLQEAYDRLTEFHYSPLADEVMPIEEYTSMANLRRPASSSPVSSTILIPASLHARSSTISPDWRRR